MRRLYGWLWRLLPDRCERSRLGCCRKGLRGNENRIGREILCDYCAFPRAMASHHGRFGAPHPIGPAIVATALLIAAGALHAQPVTLVITAMLAGICWGMVLGRLARASS